MKYKTTRKAIINGAHNIRYAGYCDLSWLLWGHAPVAYTSGAYGWNFDVYNVNDLTICTGYRGMPGARLEGVAEYEARAKSICCDYSRPYEERKLEVEKLLAEFCEMNGGVLK